jgi:hypothetical protein
MGDTFYQLVAELVDKKMQEKGKKRMDIAHDINVSESFAKKLHSPPANKHYNMKHLYLLSKYWGVSVDSFMPTKENLKGLHRYRNQSEEYIDTVLEKIEEELREEKNYD